MADDRRGVAGGQGFQIGDNNTQVNYFNVTRPPGGRDDSSAGDSVSASSLSGPQVGRLRDALVAAFDEETLEVFLLEKLDKDLAHLTPSKGDFPYRVFKLIRRAAQEGWVTALISEAARARPGSAALRDLVGEARD